MGHWASAPSSPRAGPNVINPRRNAFIVALVSSVIAACSASPVRSTAPEARAAWLRGADCLDPSTARSWHDVSTTELVVDAGRRKYRISLPASCTRIGLGPVLRFDGDPFSGRVCGVPGDAVLLDDGQRCLIERLELVDAATWNEAANGVDGELHGETPAH
jgi:hypothetical protein